MYPIGKIFYFSYFVKPTLRISQKLFCQVAKETQLFICVTTPTSLVSICDVLRDLVPFLQFKKLFKNTYRQLY